MEQGTETFHCCCKISRNEFEIDGTTGIYIFNSIVLVFTSISTTIGNFMVLISIWRTPSLHSPSNVLLFGLALSDLGVGLFVVPIAFVYNIAKIKGLAYVFCNSAVAINFSAPFLCFASLLTMTALSVDMYIALYLHLRYQEIVTVKRTIGVLVCIWIISITYGLLYLLHGSFEIIAASLIFPLLLVTTLSYYKVFRIVRHHQGQIRAQVQLQQQREDQDENQPSIAEHRKSFISKFFIYCFLLLCYLPFIVMMVVCKTTSESTTKQYVFETTALVIYFNSTLNPIVYCWRFENIRTAIIRVTKELMRQNITQ